MLIYLLKISICWASFYLLYIAFLSRETLFKSNRGYLLGTLLLSLLIPFLNLPQVVEPTGFTELTGYYLKPITIGVQSVEQAVESTVMAAQSAPQFNWLDALLGLYLIGVCLASIRLFYGLYQIYTTYLNAEKIPFKDYTLIKTTKAHLPFSFGKALFCSSNYDTQNPDNQKVIQHELAHIRQWHTLDVLLLEILSVLFWCCLPLYGYKHSLRHIHEYLADAEVLKSTSKRQYGMLLLRQVHPQMAVALANHFNQSQLKKRIIMMTGKQSTSTSFFKYFLLIPVALILFLAFRNSDFTSFENTANSSALSVLENFDEAAIRAQFKAYLDDCTSDIYSKKAQETCYIKFEKYFQTQLEAYPNHAQELVKIAETVAHEKQLMLMIAREESNQSIKSISLLPIKGFVDEVIPEEIFKVVEEMPRFPGCEHLTGSERKDCAQMEMLHFIFGNIKYPEEARANNIQGTVVLNFVIDKNGEIVRPRILRSIGGGCDEAVLEVAAQMPTWIPGKQRGKAVAVEFNLPVKFKIEDDEVVQRKLNNGKMPEELDVKQINIHPNPSNGIFNLDVVLDSKSPSTLYITDAMGKIVQQRDETKIGDGSIHFDISEMPKGTYYLTLVQDGKYYTETFVKQ